MAEYMNAGTYNDSTEWMPGGLRGFVSGQREGIRDEILQRQFRDSDLANQGKTLEYQRALKNVPLEDAQRKLAIGQAGVQQQEIDSGRTQEAAMAKHISEMEDAKLKRFQTHIKAQLSMGELADQLDAGIGDSATIPPHMSQTLKKIMSDAGMPALPDDPVEARAAIKKAAEGYRNSGQRAQKAAELASKEQMARERNMGFLEGKYVTAGATENAATTRAGATVDAAKIRAGASAGAQPKIGSSLEAIKRDVAERGVDALDNEGKIALYEQNILQTLGPQQQKDLDSKLSEVQNLEAPPEKKAQMLDEARAKIIGAPWQLLQKAKAKLAGKTTSSTSQGSPTSAAQVLTKEEQTAVSGLKNDGDTIKLRGRTYKKQGNKLVVQQ